MRCFPQCEKAFRENLYSRQEEKYKKSMLCAADGYGAAFCTYTIRTFLLRTVLFRQNPIRYLCERGVASPMYGRRLHKSKDAGKCRAGLFREHAIVRGRAYKKSLFLAKEAYEFWLLE